MATPTASELRTLAKLGIAMPDGSYYIRNAADLDNAILAVGRSKPGDGQTAEERRMEVRRHVIKRAKALNLSSKIPDTWNPDGSLKHMDLQEFIEHYGVKGMHWRSHKGGGLPQGPHLKPNAAPGQGRLANLTADQRKFQIDRLTEHVAELEKQRAANPKAFKGHNDILRARARLHVIKQQHAKAEAQAKAKSPVTGGHVPTVQHEDLEAFLEHFGRKGMRWGVHLYGPNRGGYSSHKAAVSSTDHVKAHDAKVKARTHGTHVLTNDELRSLTERLNLEQSYKRLTENPGNYGRGKGLVQEVLHVGKIGLDAYNTGKQIKKVIDELKK